MRDLSRRSDAAKAVAKADRRFAWWLVWLYPPRFRRDVGLSLVDAIEDRMRSRRAAGASTPGARIPAILDTLRNASGEWIATLSYLTRPTHPTYATDPTDLTHQTHPTYPTLKAMPFGNSESTSHKS